MLRYQNFMVKMQVESTYKKFVKKFSHFQAVTRQQSDIDQFEQKDCEGMVLTYFTHCFRAAALAEYTNTVIYLV